MDLLYRVDRWDTIYWGIPDQPLHPLLQSRVQGQSYTNLTYKLKLSHIELARPTFQQHSLKIMNDLFFSIDDRSITAWPIKSSSDRRSLSFTTSNNGAVMSATWNFTFSFHRGFSDLGMTFVLYWVLPLYLTLIYGSLKPKLNCGQMKEAPIIRSTSADVHV